MNDHAPRLLDALDAFEDGIYIVSEDFTVEYMNRFMKTCSATEWGKSATRCCSIMKPPVSGVITGRFLRKTRPAIQKFIWSR